MKKTLGLDLGTNSLGWAIVATDDNGEKSLVARGGEIFPEAVNRDKNDNESPRCQERTTRRGLRRRYFRKRSRKVNTLAVLSKNGLCPRISDDELRVMRHDGRFPFRDDVVSWLSVDVVSGKNPYRDRHECLHRKLDLSLQSERFILGRALYSIDQRRGYMDIRNLDAQNDEDDKKAKTENEKELGKVKSGIAELEKEMQEAGFSFVGDYFHHLLSLGRKIRGHYTSREQLVAEFKEICRVQGLSSELEKELYRAIFYQRPLKSQKGSVGHCTFVPDKYRCQVSHPRFEEFRMLCFVNSIRIRRDGEAERALNEEERLLISPLFYRRSISHFKFEEIAKKISGKGNYAYIGDRRNIQDKYNYRMDDSVSGCPVSASIAASLDCAGECDWVGVLCSVYRKSDGKTPERIVDDVWHALVNFDRTNLLVAWLQENLQITKEAAEKLATKTALKGDYASLSLKAVDKMLPWLRQGYVYSKAVYLANLDEVVPKDVWKDDLLRRDIIENVLCELDMTGGDRKSSQYDRLSNYLTNFADPDTIKKNLWHPSMIERYKEVQPDENGVCVLGSPKIRGLKNPVLERGMSRLRATLNPLLKTGVIDAETVVNVEIPRSLNSMNERMAIRDYQKEREAENVKYGKSIKEVMGPDYVPTGNDLLRYRLWEEQGRIDLYTGEQISPTEFLGDAKRYDIEHTIPRSRGGEDAEYNLTLCDRHYNRDVKKGRIPSELPEISDILPRLSVYDNEIARYGKIYYAKKMAAKTSGTKEAKDKAIQQMKVVKMKLDYLKNKRSRFDVKDKDILGGFTLRQDVDIKIVCRYALEYLGSVFDNVHVIKGSTTSDFRKVWDLQDADAVKDRSSHAHHVIDAVTIACVDRPAYHQWAKWAKDELGGGTFEYPKPWGSFTEDVLTIPETLLMRHYTPDRMMTKTRKKVRVRGRIVRDADGKPRYATGDSARCSLHNDTFYGLIQNAEGEKRFVKRELLDGKTFKSEEEKRVFAAKIVDQAVRMKVLAASLEDIKAGNVWMDEKRGVRIKKVRVYASYQNCVPLKDHQETPTVGKEYKRPYYVLPNNNYAVAVYEGKKRSSLVLSCLEVAKARSKGEEWLPMVDAQDRPLRYLLKKGMLVLFYEKSPSEVYEADEKELVRRLYKINAITTTEIRAVHSLNASRIGDLIQKYGAWSSKTKQEDYLHISHSLFNALIENVDFEFDNLGRIVFLNR